MLDNMVTENCMATMPIEILANAKQKANNNKYTKDSNKEIIIKNQNTTTAAPVTKPNKTKTILNWLKNTTNNGNNNNSSVNINSNRTIDKKDSKRTDTIKNDSTELNHTDNTSCTCPSVKQLNNTNSASFFRTTTTTKSNKDDDTLREFRGVQTLRNFWNKRITANKETALKTKSSKQQNVSKSVSCLVNAINNTGEPPPRASSVSREILSDRDLLKARKLRALSLHDCSRDSPEFDEISLSDIDVQKHLEKDNFYKYKTAEQASKLRELSEHSALRKLSNGIVLPAGQKTERFDWLKRHEKFLRKKTVDYIEYPVISTNSQQHSDNGDKQLIITTSATCYNNSKMHTQPDSSLSLPTAIGQNNHEVDNAQHNTNKHSNSSEISTPTPNETNSPQHTISRRKATTRKDSAKTLNSCSSISRDSSTTSLAATSNTSNGHRTVVKRNSSARKYSFKTHTRSYHVPRKMHTNKDSTNAGNAAGNSLVAKLTQQFNDIIQKDKTLLEEIKRKNGILMTHKGHVYKVVDIASLNRSQSPTVSRNSSKVLEGKGSLPHKRSTPSSTVQKNIKKFESESRGLKPKVPLKSLQVLKKSNELVLGKTQANGMRVIVNRGNNKKDLDVKSESKPQTLALPSTLEMVQEEVKTPVENNEENTILGYSEESIREDVKPETSQESKELFRDNLKPNESVIYKTIQKTQEKKEEFTKVKEISHLPLELVLEKCHDEEEYNEKKEVKTENIDKEIETKTTTCEEIKQKPLTKDNASDTAVVDVKSEENHTADKQTKVPTTITETMTPTQTLSKEKETTKPQTATTLTESLTPPMIALTEVKAEALETPDTSSENLNVPEDDEKRKRKHKYAKIYEKLRFFTPFSHSSKKQKFNTTSPSSTDLAPSEPSTPNENLLNEEETHSTSLLKSGEYTPMRSPTPKCELTYCDDVYSIMFNPEAKLLDALEQVDKKLQNLSQETERTKETPSSPVLESDEYGQPLKPNSSFLHPNYTKDTRVKSSSVIQAVNVTLVNAIEGEQMIMEQKEIQKVEIETKEEDNTDPTPLSPPQLPPRKQTSEEPLYEPICVVDKNLEPKTEASYNNCEYNITTASETTKIGHIIEEDIYQTVEEAIKDTNTPEIVTYPLPELDGYEPIENPDDIAVSLKCDVNNPTKSVTYDGYEEYTPNVEMAPITPTSTTTAVRKVTDELPDLPKPKRILPKSPVPSRAAPKPPLPHLQTATEESREYPCQEPHYYGSGEENIYDTIKGSHCYESLQCVTNKMQSSPSLMRIKNSDCVSLTSNCYESISHFKRTNIIGHHSGGSSNGSTLTISSENKTNSLYEDSLNSSLHYSSRHIDQLNVHTANGIMKSVSDGNSSVIGGYGASIGRTSDTSDEWTDVTDNESDEANSKPKFIIVRERSKVHRSPDWSRRIRDKRQRKSKSCIEDDDPDHYYEQLSPQALSKRHSLLEPSQRTSSLQRNQGPVRVSKRGKQMSYSAHALGQHISDDSFDSDTDDYYESEHFKNAHNDSGVDIRTTKLPDPPTSSNQMYSFVKKFKNFIVNKKSPNSSKHGGSQQKIYESTSQFYGTGQYESKQQALPPTPPASTLQVPATKELSTSENNLVMAQNTVSKPDAINTATESRKSKSGKSLKSRIRKSLVGFDSKQLSTLTPTRSTFYIEDPVQDNNCNGQLDSGFSEKALSGEMSATTTSTPTTEAQKFSTVARKAKKEAKLANSQRRRTTIGIRPHEPPPPPPPENNSKTKRQSNTSWYAECGVFKNGTTNLLNDDSQILNGQNGSGGSSIVAGSTWYEEAGLYQTSGVSVASSSGSSGVSTSNEAGPADEMTHSMFSNEPLYQIYSAAKLEAISRDMQDGSSTDGYEEIGDRQKNNNASESTRKSSRPSALQLVEPKSGPERTLWSQIPEVINSYIIPTMTTRERALMEAKFEIITSEASYLKSLNLLRTHYMNHPVFRDQNVVSSRDRKSLFAHIVPVHECSEKLLTELESCWQDNIMLIGLSKRIYTIAEKYFHVYVEFCEHQGRMDRTLKRLREAKGLFAQNLELLESSPACCGLTLHSFLMLPMQRITRLPLLIDAVFSKCHPNDDEYENWKMCLAIMNKIVTQCNEAANKSEQAFEIERISRQLEFPSAIRPLAIAPAGVLAPGTKPRYLVKKGELTHLIWRGDDAKLTFGKKFSKTSIFAFLFSDLLVLTKRKAEEQFSVFDYCPRNMLTITSGDTLPQLPTKDLNSQSSKNLILMTLLENHERKTVELLLSCPSVSEKERWLQAMRPPESETPGEKLYEQWDCPQVIAKQKYENSEPDVLNLEEGDVVNVTRKLPDGWYQGERIRDGAIGWFPSSCTEEVNSAHVRARNLKQRHRLLTFTATYLELQKRSK